MSCKCKCKFLYGIDLYGKEANLYYKGESEKHTYTGITFTIIYLVLYAGFVIYQIVRMLEKEDVTFYDTYAFTGEPPKIQLSNDKFYGGFALGHPLTLETFVDDSIYYVRAFYISRIKQGDGWNVQKIPLELETCQLEKFGENYRELFKDKKVNQLHCVKHIDQLLQGHLTYDAYSYFLVKFFPCINSTVNNFSCKPLSVIRQLLTQTFVTFKMEDIDLTPQLYNSPVQLRAKEVSANIGASLFQDVHSYFQIANIETDEDILGFDIFSRIKKEKFIKYDQSIILSSLKAQNIFESGDSIVDITIQLSEKELTQKRTYPKLIQVLGDIGGLMEVFFSLFRLISSFLTETLYDQSIVNTLFEFDIDKKIVLLKKHNKKRRYRYSIVNVDPKIFTTKKTTMMSRNNSLLMNDDNIGQTKGKINEIPILNKRNSIKDDIFLSRNKKRKSKFKTIIMKVDSKNSRNSNNEFKSTKNNKMLFNNEFEINSYDINSKENMKTLKDKEKGKETEKEKESNKEQMTGIERKGLIKRIKVNRFCASLCFLCARKRKNVQNILLDEGMKIIIEKLDIINLFKKIYRDEKLQTKIETKEEIIEMSDECKKNLHDLFKNTLYKF
jgi:hypothetical protein